MSMNHLNEVTIIGNLGQDPEVKTLPSGGKVVNLSVATTENWKDKQTGEKRESTEWHRVTIFNENIGAVAGDYLRKGSLVWLRGQLKTRKWKDQKGEDRYTTEIVLQGFNCGLKLIGGRNDRQSSNDGNSGGNSGRQDSGRSRPRDTDSGSSGFGGGFGGPDDDSDIPF